MPATITADFRDRAEQVFRSLLWRIGAKPLTEAVATLVDEVCRCGAPSSADEALLPVYRRTRGEVLAQLVSGTGERHRRMLDTTIPPLPPPLSFDFHCDAGLGGLARWLRAAGYDAAFWPDIDDDDLLRKMTASAAILLTTDRRLMDRGVITSGAIAALLVPISLNKHQQLAHVRGELDLVLKTPRCMACGGRLAEVEKTAVRERIPPRTYPWLDEYYVCQRCQRLFWKGTHWQRIEADLGTSSREPS
ncbi:MAG TPA: Mut7-C RNAse domain-containing protein [Pirellulales bacterium]|nr:Mut7-C RNAse domain-containing protein [Pirellulales bacterium]